MIPNPCDNEQVMSLFDVLTDDVSTDRPATIWERAEAFHRENPNVLDELVKLARELRGRGVRRYSIAGLFEVLRHRYTLQTEDPNSEWKLNNSYKAFYARAVLEAAPDLGEFFELRSLREAS